MALPLPEFTRMPETHPLPGYSITNQAVVCIDCIFLAPLIPEAFKGPTNERFPTDKSFLKTFVGIFIGWIVLAIFVFTQGDVETHGSVLPTSVAIYLGPLAIATLPIFILCSIFVVILRYYTAFMVWFSIVLVNVYFVLALVGILSQFKDMSSGIVALVSFVVIAIMGGFILVIYLCRKKIIMSIALIKEAGCAIGDVKSTLILPPLPLLIQGLTLLFGVYVMVYSFTIKNDLPKPNTSLQRFENNYGYNFAYESSSSSSTSSTPGYVGILQAYNVVMCIWTLFFIKGVYNMVLAGTFAHWYWTPCKSDLPYFTVIQSFMRTCRYHLGTVAVGSLLLTLIRLLHIIFSVNEKSVKMRLGCFNPFFCICKCLPTRVIGYVEKLLKMLNKYAYIMCAMNGKSFTTSAKDGLGLIIRNILQVCVLTKVVDWVFVLIRLEVAVVSSLIFFMFIGFDQIILIYFFYTYFIAAIFFEVYSSAVDTLFMCFLQELELRDSSPNTPQFMSDRLKRILNKTSEEDAEQGPQSVPTF